jgi:tRNA modification GTPase
MNDKLVRAALVTPAGRGALASIVILGGAAADVVQSRFASATNRHLADEPPDRIFYGTWLGTGEEVVVATRRDNNRVEIHCHGGIAASRSILSDLRAAGCEVVDWRQMVAIEESNPARAAARVALAECVTERTAAILLDQYRGAFEQAIRRILEKLEAREVEAALASLLELADWAEFGRHLACPWRMIIAGAPNVGKSTLINALVGYERAIVFDQPGTTRDLVSAVTALDGWPIELTDTAGLRKSDQALEQEGIARAKAEMQVADLILLVFDATQDWSGDDEKLALEWSDALVVYNKCDLLAAGAGGTDARDGRPIGLLASAKTGVNIPELIRRIVRRLVPAAPPPGAAIPFTTEQVAAIKSARDSIERGQCARGIEALVRLVKWPGAI